MKYILKSLQTWHLTVFQLGIEQISLMKNKIELVIFFALLQKKLKKKKKKRLTHRIAQISKITLL